MLDATNERSQFYSAVNEAHQKAKAATWANMTLMDRVEAIQEAGGNIFAARFDYITEAADPSGSLLDHIY